MNLCKEEDLNYKLVKILKKFQYKKIKLIKSYKDSL
jgi:hypothetical protein